VQVVPAQPRKTRVGLRDGAESKRNSISSIPQNSEAGDALDLSILLPHVSYLEERDPEEKGKLASGVLSPLKDDRRQKQNQDDDGDEENVPPDKVQIGEQGDGRRNGAKGRRVVRVRRSSPPPCISPLKSNEGPTTRSMARKLFMSYS